MIPLFFQSSIPLFHCAFFFLWILTSLNCTGILHRCLCTRIDLCIFERITRFTSTPTSTRKKRIPNDFVFITLAKQGMYRSIRVCYLFDIHVRAHARACVCMCEFVSGRGKLRERDGERERGRLRKTEKEICLIHNLNIKHFTKFDPTTK